MFSKKKKQNPKILSCLKQNLEINVFEGIEIIGLFSLGLNKISFIAHHSYGKVAF